LEFDVAIVGAGPAGLFAAYELAEGSNGTLSIVVIEKGCRVAERACPLHESSVKTPESPQACKRCSPCHIMHGIGGAGLFSSGTFNLRPDIGGDLDKLVGSFTAAERLVQYADSILVKFGADESTLVRPGKNVSVLERLAARSGARFIPTPQRVLGSEKTVEIIERMHGYLEERGVRFLPRTEVHDIVRASSTEFRLKTGENEILARYVILAPGRSGASWFSKLAERLDIAIEPGPLDVGVRVEIPAFIAEPVTSTVRDPKIVMYTKAYDDKVRTFCTNPGGFVVQELYHGEAVAVNGVSYRTIKSKNTNFALLVTVELTDPLEDTITYGRSIMVLATKLGGGKPIIHRLGDLLAGRRSTWSRISKSSVEPTLKNVTPGDITMALPYRVVADILEALERLDTVMPGVYSNQTLLYAPEIKFYSVRAKVNRKLETTVENLFVAGDGAGLSRGINGAAVTGILAARGVLEKAGFYS